jgi:hypothetical protein
VERLKKIVIYKTIFNLSGNCVHAKRKINLGMLRTVDEKHGQKVDHSVDWISNNYAFLLLKAMHQLLPIWIEPSITLWLTTTRLWDYSTPRGSK